MLNFVYTIKKWLKTKIIKSIINVPANCIIGSTARVRLLFGSRKDNIKIGYRVILNGTLVSQYNGKISIGKYVQIGINAKIFSVESVKIGDYTAIATNVVICDNNNHPINPQDRLFAWKTLPGSAEMSWKYSDHKRIVIERNCWIGENSRICKGVTIGEGSIIAANSVVTKNVPANCIVAGNPAKIVKTDIDKLPRYFND